MSDQSDAAAWGELTAFKQDLIVATLRLGGYPDTPEDDRPYGLGIKDELERLYDDDVNHGRLYPNLDRLVDAGLMEKHERDKRTNTYCTTDRAVNILHVYLSEWVGLRHDRNQLMHGAESKRREQDDRPKGVF